MTSKSAKLQLPAGWSKKVKSTILQVISLASMALTAARSRRHSLRSELDQARQEIALLEQELKLKDVRMARVPARHRPYYQPAERLAILELRAARSWSLRQTARRFHLQPATVAGWMKRIDDEGEAALLQTPEPVNRFPDFVRYLVKRLKALCPTMGKKRIAQTPARAGLALGISTVARILKERDRDRPEPDETAAGNEATTTSGTSKPVKAEYPNHTWQVDLTLVPTRAGFWTSWFPFSVLQLWPFCWWVACVIDHHSRRVMAFEAWRVEPKSRDIQRLLARLTKAAKARPRYIVKDKGRQFDCRSFRRWCRRRGIRARYASAGSLRATAIVERFIRSLKDEWLRRIFVPLDEAQLKRELALYQDWFNGHRPHQGLDGRTPDEFYEGKTRAPPEPIKIARDQPLTLAVSFRDHRRCLPVVEIKRAA